MIGRRGFFGGLIAMAAGWTGGDPGTGRGSGIRGGLPGPRPDQQYRPIGPQGPVGSSTGIVKARQVIIKGPNDGEFVYNATGTTLIYSNVGAATRDPLLRQPVLAGTTWYQAGGVVNINDGVQLVYAPTAAAGNLVASIAPAGSGVLNAGTDAFGNAYLSGVASYFNDAGVIVANTQRLGAVQFAVALTHAGPFTASTSISGASLGAIPAAQTSALVLAEQSGAPATPGGAGGLYVDATGHLHYIGPGGTNTVLAGP